jgi:hypothetical protein
MLFRPALIGLAIVLILLGLLILPLPLPFGILLFLTGCGLLVSVSETASRYFRKLRTKYPGFNRLIARVEFRLPGALGRALRRTAP